MSRPVLSSATRRLQQSTAHCQRPFSTTRFFSALSEPITRSSSIYNADANATSLHALTRPSRYTLRRVNVSSFSVPRHRAFSSSTIRLSAKVVQNAKNDEEGKPLMVGISERAAEVRYSTSRKTFVYIPWRRVVGYGCPGVWCTVARCGIPDRSRTSFLKDREKNALSGITHMLRAATDRCEIWLPAQPT